MEQKRRPGFNPFAEPKQEKYNPTSDLKPPKPADNLIKDAESTLRESTKRAVTRKIARVCGCFDDDEIDDVVGVDED